MGGDVLPGWACPLRVTATNALSSVGGRVLTRWACGTTAVGGGWVGRRAHVLARWTVSVRTAGGSILGARVAAGSTIRAGTSILVRSCCTHLASCRGLVRHELEIVDSMVVPCSASASSEGDDPISAGCVGGSHVVIPPVCNTVVRRCVGSWEIVDGFKW